MKKLIIVCSILLTGVGCSKEVDYNSISEYFDETGKLIKKETWKNGWLIDTHEVK